MTCTKETTIWCDGKECGNWESHSTRAGWIRNKLKEEGWKVAVSAGDGVQRDFCPDCKDGVETGDLPEPFGGPSHDR